VRLFVLTRHAQSALNLEGRVNGDPSLPSPLTPTGEAEARRLGQQLAAIELDLCVHTRFERTLRTADLALEGRDVPRSGEPLLDAAPARGDEVDQQGEVVDAGVSLGEEIGLDPFEPADDLAAAVRAAGIDLGTARAWDDVFYCAFVTRVEPRLAALDEPLFLVDWPVRLGALARRTADDPRVVERFEAYVGGIELCNAFGELTDPLEQRARFEDDLASRRDRGLATYPIDERLLAALTEGLPPSAGVALGVDRLVMMVVGADHIRDVLAFTADER